MSSPSMGAFVAVVGPSGAGKDTLIAAARLALAREEAILFARRVVTRPAVGEDHDTLSPAAFEAARAAGRFCLAWTAHGLAYGVPREALALVRAGRVVVVNLSRGAIAAAEALDVPVVVLEVDAPAALRALRLAARGRESDAAIEARLAREAPLAVGRARHVRIVNDGRPEAAAAAMVAALAALVPAKESAAPPGTGRSDAPG
jgi:ribose 1,5-bisphosphokinase